MVLLFSLDTGICVEDVIQTLIDLRLAHTRASTLEAYHKHQEARDQRNRRRQKSNSDSDQYDDNNNNTLDSTSVLVIDEDLLHSNLVRLANENSSLKQVQHIFDRNYLRLIGRR